MKNSIGIEIKSNRKWREEAEVAKMELASVTKERDELVEALDQAAHRFLDLGEVSLANEVNAALAKVGAGKTAPQPDLQDEARIKLNTDGCMEANNMINALYAVIRDEMCQGDASRNKMMQMVDHLQTFQEGVEWAMKECMNICRSEDWEDQQGWGKMYAHKIQKQFGPE